MITGLLGHGRARALMHSSPRPLAPGLLPPSTCLLLTPYSSLLISVHLLASSGPLVHSLTLSHVPTHVTSSRVCICTLVSSNMCDIPYVSVSVCLHQHAFILALHMFQMFPDITLRVSHVSTHLFTHGSYASAHVFVHMPQMSSHGSPMRYLYSHCHVLSPHLLSSDIPQQVTPSTRWSHVPGHVVTPRHVHPCSHPRNFSHQQPYPQPSGQTWPLWIGPLNSAPSNRPHRPTVLSAQVPVGPRSHRPKSTSTKGPIG